MVSSAPPTSITSPSSSEDPPLRPMSSSLYGSAANSARAESSVTTRRENRCPDFTISCMRFSSALRSSGVNGRSTSKS